MKKEVAQALLDIQAVFLSPEKPFTWSSGIKSPIYCDNRLVLSYPEIRKTIEKELASLILKHFPNVEVIMGTATAGIAHAAIIADILNLPMGYVRSVPKDHGRTNAIEGKVEENQKVVVIEDLISTGGSVVNVVETLRLAKTDVLGVISIFTYHLKEASDHFEKHQIRHISLSDFNTLIDLALESNLINENEYQKCLAFQKNPKLNDWMNL
ncbi:orotate phosphoribosyltransferase [Peloplasma aerotolerans]|jgi:orotate phosphoribosyltransferase|uniref:Orotate phosphoribosyltransferase n=1 Tax=Peloplasma aerotolerans TaxID=3044389 RepID=A0AAW6U6F2_9MOLU|nr:orotate phosphoribosyltransferase [Mariniplasma sp. M4Ah]MDI6452112.1 orotate phosphoribosyltransferase [Mariniplasma sp. M4Ah]